MKIVRCTAYGSTDVLKLEDVPIPEPKPTEVLIRIEAASLTAGDCELRRSDIAFLFWLPLRVMFGVLRPRHLVLGQDIAGVVEAVGSEVTRFQPGDRIFGLTGMKFGGHADYVCLPEEYTLCQTPQTLTPAEAVSIPVGGYNALDFLTEAEVSAGQHVVIHGAGGTIGTMAIQLAKHMGATVTAIDAAEKLQTLSDIGADHVIDYRTEDFTQNGLKYDVIIDLVYRTPKSLPSLKDGGFYVLGNPAALQTLRGKRTDRQTGKTVIPALAAADNDKLAHLADLCARGILKPVVDLIYPLDQAAEAHRYVESGAKIGTVVLQP